jgi:uncharacterized damage-inducible protein DinB
VIMGQFCPMVNRFDCKHTAEDASEAPSVSLALELAALFRRDLTRLMQELRAFPEDGPLWVTPPGISNSIGTLVLHLEANLRDYIGLQLGGLPYSRQREREFSETGLGVEDLRARVESLITTIPEVLTNLSDADLSRLYSKKAWSTPVTIAQFLIHLHGHLNYHLGQIDYLRRILTHTGAVDFGQL